MDQAKKEIQLSAIYLDFGETEGGNFCPFCQATHERKLSITRTETGVLYNCYRASCGKAGFIPTGHWEYEPPREGTGKKKENKPYKKDLFPLNIDHKNFFYGQWDIAPIGFMINEYDEYALPILNPIGLRKGWIMRKPSWKGVTPPEGKPIRPGAKALTYKDSAGFSKLSWSPLISNEPRNVVIVEDILSAWKVGQAHEDLRGVAINGANVGYAEVKEIMETRPYSVTIWLDPDATKQAFSILNKWGLSMPRCSVVTSIQDPKDELPEVIRRKLNVGCEGSFICN